MGGKVGVGAAWRAVGGRDVVKAACRVAGEREGVR